MGRFQLVVRFKGEVGHQAFENKKGLAKGLLCFVTTARGGQDRCELPKRVTSLDPVPFTGKVGGQLLPQGECLATNRLRVLVAVGVPELIG